jgi:hypothetical protein
MTAYYPGDPRTIHVKSWQDPRTFSTIAPSDGPCRTQTNSRLAPVPLSENVFPMSTMPAMRNPTSMAARRGFPPPRGPGISIPVPPMISSYPNVTCARRVAPSLDHRSGRRDPHDYLPSCCIEGYRTHENQTDQSRTQHTAPHPQLGRI